MNESEAENLIERGLSAGRPDEIFTARLLADSTAALVRARRRRSAWRRAEFAAAAALIVGVAFLGGRLSAPPAPAPVAPGAVTEHHKVRVRKELIAWVEAACLFEQLGMEDRMARAVERAGRLLPADTFVADGQTLPVLAAESIGNQEERVELAGMAGPHPPAEGISQILAQSLGRLTNEN